jgi:uncharacterized protein YecT (DUF1311 family)
VEPQSVLSIAWLDAVVKSNWWPLLLPAGYAVFRFIEYLLKRRVEGKPASEKLEQYKVLVDIQERLNKGNITIADLNKLRAHVMGDAAENVLQVAEKYTAVAQKLVFDAEQKFDGGKSLVTITQAEMNILSGEKAAQADKELAAVCESLLRHLSQTEATALQLSQEAWRAFRDAEVQRESLAWEGGSIRPLMVNAKHEAMTQERIASLQSVADGVEAPALLNPKRVKTPLNLFDVIEPGVPQQRVRDLLGAPTYVEAERWCYRFEETYVELSFNEVDAIRCVVMALCHGYLYRGSHPHHATDVPLGQLTLGDLQKIDQEMTVEFRDSLRTQELFVRGRIGPPGAWGNYSYGALSTFSGAGCLQDTSFKWDKASEKLLTDPNQVLVNWVAATSSSLDVPSFDWFIK